MSDTPTIQQALAAVMGDVREVAKNDRNTQQNFSFRGVDSVVNAVAPALRKHGVVVMPHLENIEYDNVVVGQKQTHMIGCRVTVTYVFIGPSGDRVSATVPGEAMDAGDKSTAKAMSVAFRTALLQALVLPTDDVDPDAVSYERAGASATPVGMSARGGAPHAAGSPPADGRPEDGPGESPRSATSAGRPAGEGEPPEDSGANSVADPGKAGGSPTTVEIPLADPDAKATTNQLENLLHVCGNNRNKALIRFNRNTGHTYDWKAVQETATKREVVAAISDVKLEGVA